MLEERTLYDNPLMLLDVQASLVGLMIEIGENILIQVCLLLARGNSHKQTHESHPSIMNEKIIHI